MLDISLIQGVFLQSLSLRDLYFQWEASGVFDFFLPGLLIFAVVFGILTSTKILGESRGINFLIALSMALIAIRVPFVSNFFSVIFPNFGVGLAILVVVVILMGLFVSKGNLPEFSNTVMWGGLGVGVIIAIVTLNQFDWFGSWWWQENWTSALWVVILVVVILPFLLPEKSKEEKQKLRSEYSTPFLTFRGSKD